MEVLVYLASRGGQTVHADELLENLWPGKVVTSASIYNCITELRHAFQDCDDRQPYVETIPKKGYRLVAPITGLAESKPEAGQNAASPFSRRMSFIVISLLAAAVLLFAWHTWQPATPTDKSIAVMAFENVSDDPEQEYFSDGISEELLNTLAQIPELKVISRGSAFSFKDKNVDTPTIAKQLNVAYVLEGSVRKMGNRVRITAQLIDARSGFHLWSETYDRELENIFVLQDEISGAILGALKSRLGLEVEVVPRLTAAASTAAHNAYLRGRFLVAQRTPTTVEGAIREYEKAISLDPDYALAHAELSIAMTLLSVFTGQGHADAIARAAPHAERALDLDPSLAEAHAATGFLSARQGNIEDARTHLSRAIQINPNYSWPHLIIAGTLERLGRYAESLVMVETAVRLDPLSNAARVWYVGALIDRNRLDEAAREMENIASTAPADYAFFRGRLNSLGGEWAKGMLDYLDAWRIDPRDVSPREWLSYSFAVIGLENEALAVPGVSLGTAFYFLGRHADASEAILADKPMSIYDRSELGDSLAAEGDYVRARPILEEMWKRSGGRVTQSGVFGAYNAAALIVIRRESGEEAGVGELMAAMRDNVHRLREAGMTLEGFVDYQDGLVTYLAGERAKGLALMAKGEEQGDFNAPGMAYLQSLYDDPGFAPIRARHEARQAREARKFLAAVCTDNPYAAFWQPADGTCEQFSAEGSK